MARLGLVTTVTELKGHCRGGDQRRQQKTDKWIKHTHGHGNAKHVIAKGADKVLADVAHGGATDFDGRHDTKQAALDERDVARFDSHIGSSV